MQLGCNLLAATWLLSAPGETVLAMNFNLLTAEINTEMQPFWFVERVVELSTSFDPQQLEKLHFLRNDHAGIEVNTASLNDR